MKSPLCSLYLVRHGQSVGNVEKRIQGQFDSPLTPKGLLQAQQTAELFKPITLHAAYASDLKRAHQTATIIATAQNITVTPTKALRERKFGPFENQRIVDIRDQLDAYDAIPHDQRFYKSTHQDIETDQQLISRSISFIKEIIPHHLGQSILLVSHGGLMRALLTYLGFGTYQTFKYDKKIHNTGFAHIETDGQFYFIKSTVGIDQPGW